MDEKYFVESIGERPDRGPAMLRTVKNPPSDLQEGVKDEELLAALVQHCKTSYEQSQGLEQAKVK
jgi:hypothetical protein